MRVRRGDRTIRMGIAAATLTAAPGVAGSRSGGRRRRDTAPAHVFAPYFETWTTDALVATASASGARYFTLAFLETTSRTSCSLAWGGVKTQTVSGSDRYVADIAALRGLGGDVIPSFGGWSADQGGTEIGDSCTDVAAIAAAYEGVVTKYDVTRLDMDIEGRSLTKPDGIDRRNKAIKLLQDWAIATAGPCRSSTRCPRAAPGSKPADSPCSRTPSPTAFASTSVNPMVFDYYDKATRRHGRVGDRGAPGRAGPARTPCCPTQDRRPALGDEGATIMNGLDDYPKKTESTSLGDAQELLAFARGTQPHEHPLDVGDPARQRRLPGVDGVERLLRDRPADLGLHPDPGAVHRSVAVSSRAAAPRTWSRSRGWPRPRWSGTPGSVTSRTWRACSAVRTAAPRLAGRR